jgi:hypothetical protein
MLRIAKNGNSAVKQSNDAQQETKTSSHNLSSMVFVCVCYEESSGKRLFGNSRRHTRRACRPCKGVVWAGVEGRFFASPSITPAETAARGSAGADFFQQPDRRLGQ